MQGRLIVLEGGEGCGKTTQIKQLQEWLLNGALVPLQKKGVSQLVVTREPGGTELGQECRKLLLHRFAQEPLKERTELLLYAADRAQHVEVLLKPQLAQGALVLCDRYTDSTIAYQGYGRGLDQRLIEQLNAIATGGLESDLTLWLDVDVEIGLARAQRRGASDRMEQADLAFHQRVRQGFAALATAYPQRIVRLDATPSIADVAQQVRAIVTQKLNQWYGA
jgi:dTMP kinase